jgi:hypothetical protein
MQSTHNTPVERVQAEMKKVSRAFDGLGAALLVELEQIDLTAERVTERTFRVAVDTLRDVFHHHPKKSTPADA